MPRKIAQTYQHRLFNDDELKLPEHDKIVRWADLTIKENVAIFLNRIGIEPVKNEKGQASIWFEKRSRSLMFGDYNYEGRKAEKLLKNVVRNAIPPLPPPPPIKSTVRWEPILKNDRGTVVGAIDLSAVILLPIAYLDFELHEARISSEAANALAAKYGTQEAFEVPIGSLKLSESDFHQKFESDAWKDQKSIVISGSKLFSISQVRWDFADRDHDYHRISIVVEAKSSIPAIGELMRQMNFYKGHVGNAKLFVVAPPEAWPNDAQNILREQGVEPINYLANS